jgi:hypothetical protein
VHDACCSLAPSCVTNRGCAAGTCSADEKSVCDSSFDNRNGAMCSGPRVSVEGRGVFLPGRGLIFLPCFRGSGVFQPAALSVFGALALDNIPPHSTCRLQQPSLHTRGRASAPQRCTQHRATPATNQQRATGLAPSTNRRQRMLPCKPTRRESRAAVLSICPNTASTSVQIRRVRDPALPRWLHCDCA